VLSACSGETWFILGGIGVAICGAKATRGTIGASGN